MLTFTKKKKVMKTALFFFFFFKESDLLLCPFCCFEECSGSVCIYGQMEKCLEMCFRGANMECL